MVELNGENHSKVCSNMFLLGQVQMRTQKFEESLVSVNKAFELSKALTNEFGSDLEIVQSKFYMLKANISFILGRYKESLEAASEGMQCITKVKSQEPTIMRSMVNTRRDLNNIRIRSVAKLEGVPAHKVRHQSDQI